MYLGNSMASAQEHLEAGKRRLEASSSQVNGSELSSTEKQPTETVRVTVSDGAGTYDGHVGGFTEASVISSNGDNASDFSQKKEHAFSKNAHSSSSTKDYNGFSADQFSFYGNQSPEHKLSSMESLGTGWGTSQQSISKISPQNSVSTFLQNEASNFSKIASGPPASSSLYQDLIEPSTSASSYAREVGKNIRGGTEDLSDPISFRFGEGKLSNSASGLFSLQSPLAQTSDSTGYGFDATSFSNHIQPESLTPYTSSRRSRPSFLDPLNVSKASSGSPFQQAQMEDSHFSNSSKSNGMSFLGSLPFHKPSMEDGPVAPHSFENSNKSSLSPSAVVAQQRPVLDSSLNRKHDFYSSKQNDDFAALEQHIEDLTQENFSLQRALEASRSLAESLSSENSSLTETYNQQRSVVDQLKSELETLQQEIKAHMVEIEAVRNEYANALLECNAAGERSKLLVWRRRHLY